MRGKALTPSTIELPLIFFKIRTTRNTRERRSLQRRARIRLNQIDDLTADERHEIACVWSQPNCNQIDSPALRKYQRRTDGPAPWETIPSRQYTRKPTGVKKPGITRFSEAANDGSFSRSQLFLFS